MTVGVHWTLREDVAVSLVVRPSVGQSSDLSPPFPPCRDTRSEGRASEGKGRGGEGTR